MMNISKQEYLERLRKTEILLYVYVFSFGLIALIFSVYISFFTNELEDMFDKVMTILMLPTWTLWIGLHAWINRSPIEPYAIYEEFEKRNEKIKHVKFIKENNKETIFRVKTNKNAYQVHCEKEEIVSFVEVKSFFTKFNERKRITQSN